MGVSGFLISWARRRATSPQAWDRWADTISEMSSNTSRRLPSGSSAPRATRVVAVWAAHECAACNSNDCCQWSSPCWLRSPRNTSNWVCTLAAKPSSPGMSASARPSNAASGARRMRVAPGLESCTTPAASSTMTPAVRLSRMVCRLARASSTCSMLCSTALRASDSCCVIWANERVSPPSSSLPCSTALGDKSPAATWRTPSASNSNGRASWLPSNTARITAPKMAKNRLKVSVPMYIRRSPPRASARSWYSRLASVTAMALANSAGGSAWVTCKKRASDSRPTLEPGTAARVLMRAFLTSAGLPVSSSPSICEMKPWLRTLRSCCALGRSGLSWKRDCPALAIMCPAPFHSTTSSADNWSRMRSSVKPAAASGVLDSWPLATRVRLARSLARASRVERPRLSPASSAVSTLTSNQLSMERDTNW